MDRISSGFFIGKDFSTGRFFIGSSSDTDFSKDSENNQDTGLKRFSFSNLPASMDIVRLLIQSNNRCGFYEVVYSMNCW
jgi:hypothetical protein